MFTPTSQAERSDDALLLAIAGERDREAFAELYARFERPAFNLARCLTGDAGLAEEAVQEGMMRVWQSAGNFQAGGNARGWVLKIVAREGLRARGKAKRRDSMEIKDPLTEEAAGAAATRESRDATADGEVLDALRRHVAKLPDVQRQIVALYYGGGLTQEEIAQEMDLQQRAVSRRLHEALEALRGQLSKAGLASAMPMLAVDGQGGGLFAALTHGDAVPAGLRERVLARVCETGARAVRETARGAAAKGGAGAMPLVLAGVLVLAGTGLYVAMNEEPARNALEAPAPTANGEEATPVQPVPETKVADGRLDVTWDFSERSVDDFEALPVKFNWRKGELIPSPPPALNWVPPASEVPGHLYAKEDATFELPVDIDMHILEVWLDLYTPPSSAWMDLGWLKPGRSPPDLYPRKTLWVSKSELPAVDLGGFTGKGYKTSNISRVRHIYIGGVHVSYVDGHVGEIIQFNTPPGPKRLALTLRNAGLIKAHVRELKAEEIPEDLRDIPAFIQRLKKEGKGAAKE